MNAPQAKETLRDPETARVAEPTPTIPTPVPPPQLPRFRAANVRLRDFSNNNWRAIAPSGLSHKDVDRTEVWAGIGDLQAFDHIDVISADRSWWAELLVIEALPGFAVMRTLRVIDIPRRVEQAGRGIPPGYDIRQADIDDDRGGWVVERLSDHALLGAGLRDYEEARRHLMDHASLRSDRDPSYLP